MPAASLTFNHFTNTRVLFADVDAVNNFFESISVSIGSENLPAATIAAIGAVKAGNVDIYEDSRVTVTYDTIANDEGSIELASKVAFDNLLAKVDAIGGYLETLTAALASAGIIIPPP